MPAFADAEWGAFTAEVEGRCETVERNGGRSERHPCTVLDGPGLGEWVADPEVWPGLHSLVRVRTERNGSYGRRQCAVRFYMASLLAIVRGHWDIENCPHRTLDV